MNQDQERDRSIIPGEVKQNALSQLEGGYPVKKVHDWINGKKNDMGENLNVDISAVYRWNRNLKKKGVDPIDRPINWTNLHYLLSTNRLQQEGIDVEPLNITPSNLYVIKEVFLWLKNKLVNIKSTTKDKWIEQYKNHDIERIYDDSVNIDFNPTVSIEETYRWAKWLNIFLMYNSQASMFLEDLDLWAIPKNFARIERFGHDMQDVHDWLLYSPWKNDKNLYNYWEKVGTGEITSLFHQELGNPKIKGNQDKSKGQIDSSYSLESLAVKLWPGFESDESVGINAMSLSTPPSWFHDAKNNFNEQNDIPKLTIDLDYNGQKFILPVEYSSYFDPKTGCLKNAQTSEPFLSRLFERHTESKFMLLKGLFNPNSL